MLELRHLRYFIAVAETGSLTKAAEKLFIAQPPLSVQIRQLEEDLGTPLFARHPKGVRLTEAGEVLLPEARFLLARATRLHEVVRLSGGDATRLAIGYVPSVASTVLPELVRRLREQNPRLQLELKEMISAEQLDALIARYIDAALVRVQARNPLLAVACRLPDPFCLALPRSHGDAPAAEVDLRRFAEQDFIAFTRHRGPAYFDQSIHLCSQAGFSPRIRFEASTVHGVLSLVGAGLGVSLVPASCALLDAPEVVLRPLRRPHQADALALVRRRKDTHPLGPSLESAVNEIFASLRLRIARAVKP